MSESDDLFRFLVAVAAGNSFDDDAKIAGLNAVKERLIQLEPKGSGRPRKRINMDDPRFMYALAIAQGRMTKTQARKEYATQFHCGLSTARDQLNQMEGGAKFLANFIAGAKSS